MSGSAGIAENVAPGRSFRARLNDTSALDLTVAADVRIPEAKQFYYWVEARRQDDGSEYQGRLRVDRDGILHSEIVRENGADNTLLSQQTLKLVAQPGLVFRVELTVSGTDQVALTTRTYLRDGPVPQWQASATDGSGDRISAAGSVGLQAFVGSTASAPGNTETDVVTEAFGSTSPSAGEAPPTTAPPAVPPVVQPPAVPPAEPPVSEPAVPTTHGSLPVGSLSYPVPSDAIVVSSGAGNDSGAGTLADPVRTVTRALAKARAGSTIVLRGGRYHESIVVPPSTPVTIQAYPREAVWFDGSRPVTEFAASGSAWRADGWTATFDSSPTDTSGAPDGTQEGWRWINAEHPLAAHPDQVWINGVEQTQVASVGALTPDTFFVDYGTSRLYLGSNPAGKLVEASDLSTAMSLRAPGTVVRGIGVRRYASSVPQQGVITTYYPRMTLENVDIRDSGTAGVGIYGVGCRLTNVTIAGSGEIGLQAGFADGLVADNVSIRESNDQHFNATPAAGGFKVGVTRGVTLRNSEIRGTDGNAFWADQSVYDMRLTGNAIQDNNRWGIVIEISSLAVIADNVITGNAREGIEVADSDRVSIWNNTIVGNRGAVQISQDSRRITQLGVSGHDPRRPQPDASMPWITCQTTLGNNILSAGATGGSILDVESWEHAFSGNDMVSSSDGNMFTQSAAGSPRSVVLWSRVGASAAAYPTLADYAASTGQDGSSESLVGTSGVDSQFRATAALQSRTSAVARPLPADVAAVLGLAAGTQHLGAWN